MDMNEKYGGLFKAMPKAPLAEFLERVLEGLDEGQRSRLIIGEVSYNRYSPTVETLEVFMCLEPEDKNHWIWVRVESDSSRGTIEEQFLTKDSYLKQELHSLEECFDYYERKNEE